MKYFCVHGHFYQPPRENPWLEEIERQSSAYPYHNWNSRISDECYSPNTQARILNGDGHSHETQNNYSLISYNFGPTLLSWLEEHRPKTYEKIIEADKLSLHHFDQCPSAMAQGYNHSILPLAHSRDKYLQIYWGLKDFEKRFSRSAQGMWLPECAVDTESLEIMSDLGIQFVVLAEHQVKFHSKTSSLAHINLKNGRSMYAFIYHGALSKAVAFERLLENGDHFHHRIKSHFNPEAPNELIHIATDGESYGHHHRFGEMALAYALKKIKNDPEMKLTNYALYLKNNSSLASEAELVENSSWSCHHGVERWKSDCGCKINTQSESTQAWRTPLREAIHHLRDKIDQECDQYFSNVNLNYFEERCHSIDLWQQQKLPRNYPALFIELWRLTQFMQTSCAWFFDDLKGLEVRQNLRYALRALEVSKKIFEKDFSKDFFEILQRATSNEDKNFNGESLCRDILEKDRLDLIDLALEHVLSTRYGCLSLDSKQISHHSEKLPLSTHKFSAELVKHRVRKFLGHWEGDFHILSLQDKTQHFFAYALRELPQEIESLIEETSNFEDLGRKLSPYCLKKYSLHDLRLDFHFSRIHKELKKLLLEVRSLKSEAQNGPLGSLFKSIETFVNESKN